MQAPRIDQKETIYIPRGDRPVYRLRAGWDLGNGLEGGFLDARKVEVTNRKYTILHGTADYNRPFGI